MSEETPDFALGNFIQLSHIYDVLMALLHEQNPEAHLALLELHHQGNIVGPNPAWNGAFLTNLANPETEDAPVGAPSDIPPEDELEPVLE